MQTYKRLLAYALVYWPKILAGGGFALIVAAATALYARLMIPVVDDLLISRDLTVLFWVCLAVIAVAAIKGSASFGQVYLMRYVGNRLVVDLRNEVYGHLLALPVSYYAQRQTGRLMSRVMNDVGIIRSMTTTGLKDVIQYSVTLVVLLGYVYVLNWQLALLVTVVMPAAYLVLVRAIRRMKRLATASQEHLAGLTARLQESLIGLRVIKSFAKEEFAQTQFRQQNQHVFETTMRMSRLMTFVSPVVEVTGSAGIALVLWAGVRQVHAGMLSPGEFMSFLVACALLYAPFKRLSIVASQLQPVYAAGERLFEILDTPTEQQRDGGHIEITAVQHSLVFDRVAFSYGPNEPPALRNVSFRVGIGEMVALVGFSGSGKSTIVNLIVRFYDPTAGRILIDGIDLRDVTRSSLRRLIGIVSQETVLFHDSVRNNIAYGQGDHALDTVIDAAKAAYAHAFITSLPQGYETVIGERGLTLSGGERQRLAIARAFLIDPAVLILDEATSSLDYEAEAMVQQALANLTKGRTTLVIAHRLSTIQQAHRIIVMESGRVVDEGTHEALIQRRGVYRRLYDRQFRDEETPEIASLGRETDV